MSKIRLARYKSYTKKCFEAKKSSFIQNYKIWRSNNEFINAHCNLKYDSFLCGSRQKWFIHFWMNSWCWSIYTDFIRSENWNDISRDHISDKLFTKTLFVLIAFNVCLKCKCHHHLIKSSFKDAKLLFAKMKINSIENLKTV